jgi:hypothetical protein
VSIADSSVIRTTAVVLVPVRAAGEFVDRGAGVGADGANRTTMLLKRRPPDIDSAPVALTQGFGHLDQGWVAVVRWLNANKVDYVLIGPAALAIRGDVGARGPVAIVPAPYGRNFDRLAAALVSQHAGLRSDRVLPGTADRGETVPVKLSADKLARGRRWLLRFSGYDLDIEAAGKRAAGATGSDGEAIAPRYQELLYEANRFELSPGVSVEVASPEDLEHFSHVRRTGVAPEFRVIRKTDARPAAAAERPELSAEQIEPDDPQGPTIRRVDSSSDA